MVRPGEKVGAYDSAVITAARYAEPYGNDSKELKDFLKSIKKPTLNLPVERQSYLPMILD